MEKILRIFDMHRPDAPPKEVVNSPGSNRTVEWLHSDNTVLSSCTDTGGIRLWGIRSNKIVKILETKSPITSAEVSQDGRYITIADGSSVKFWDANNFGLLKSYDMPCNVESTSLELKQDNTFIARGEDMWVHRFDFQTREKIRCNKGHHGPVHCVRYAPGGESYTLGSEDGTVKIWEVDLVNHEKSNLSGHVKLVVEEVVRKVESLDLNKKASETK